MAEPEHTAPGSDSGMARRQFLTGSSVAMACGMAASYGTLAVYAGRYLYPTTPLKKSWLFVTDLRSVSVGDAVEWESPTGEHIVVARRADTGAADDFVALSSVCPHLGCQVHWQSQQNRFFCPCHNGVFDPEGRATEGPPAAAGQSLKHYPLMVDDGMLFVEVPLERLV